MICKNCGRPIIKNNWGDFVHNAESPFAGMMLCKNVNGYDSEVIVYNQLEAEPAKFKDYVLCLK